MEIDEAWSTCNRYFDMTEYLEWKASSERDEASCYIKRGIKSGGQFELEWF